MINRVKTFITKDIWKADLASLSLQNRFLYRQLRVFVLAFRGFNEDGCMVRSSALTYYSVLSIVPVFAMIFGIAKGFGMEERLNKVLTQQLSGQEDILNKVLDFSHNLLETTKGGLIAGVGVGVLLWSVIKVMTSIEQAFNAIWTIKEERTLFRKFTEYLSFVLLAPVLIIVATSATVFITAYVRQLGGAVGLETWFNTGATLGLKLVPYLVIWLLFTFMYILMPNTNVRWQAALPAAIVAGTLYQVTEWAYFNFQIGAVKYNAIYGSFAALPLFLVWLQTSWMIVLFGGELSFANQNHEKYEYESEVNSISAQFKKKIAAVIAHKIVKQYTEGKDAPNVEELSDALKLPHRLVSLVIYDLNESNIITEIVHKKDKTNRYRPAIPVEQITVGNIVYWLDKSGADNIPLPASESYNKISDRIDLLYEEFKKSNTSIVLKDL